MKKSFLIVVIILILLFAVDLFATDYTSNSSGNWGNRNIWTPSGVPGSGDNVVIGHAVELKSNEFVNNLTISAGGTLVIGNNTFTINGTVSGTGTVTGSASSVLVISGTGIMGTLYFTAGGQQLSSLTLNRTSGDVTLGTNLTVSTLTLTNGVITTGSNKLTLGTGTGSPGTLNPSVPTSSSYINGNFERWITSTLYTNIYFPLGSASYFRPAKISYDAPPSSDGTLLGVVFDADPGSANTSILSDAGPYTLDKYSNEVYWRFTPTTLAGNTYSISLGAYGISGVSSVNWSKLRVIKRTTGSSNLWTITGTHSPTTGSSSFPDVNRTGLTGYSEFGIAGYSGDGNTLSNSPLPVVLTSFTSSVKGCEVKLIWRTVSETNNKGFDVERKNNLSGWTKIGYVEANGRPSDYVYEDRSLQTGMYNYRLKQTDFNGNYEYFELNGEVVISTPNKFYLSQNYPNPFNPVTNLKFSIPEKSRVSLRIYDISGREVETIIDGIREAGYYTLQYSAGRISSGVYFFTLEAGKYRETKMMTVIK